MSHPAFAWSLVLSAGVVFASLIPLGAARSQADFVPADLAAPRAMFERLPAWGKRANWAHQNSFEAFGLHAPACLLALIAAAATGHRRAPDDGQPRRLPHARRHGRALARRALSRMLEPAR